MKSSGYQEERRCQVCEVVIDITLLTNDLLIYFIAMMPIHSLQGRAEVLVAGLYNYMLKQMFVSKTFCYYYNA